MNTHRISWDGLSFRAPANWELALYKFLKRGVARIELEDEYAVRLEAEWVRTRHTLEVRRLQERYRKLADDMTRKVDAQAPVPGLPPGWIATLHTLSVAANEAARGIRPDERPRLLTAFYLAPGGHLFAYLVITFMPEDRDDPLAIMRLIASEFGEQSGPLATWELMDIAFQVPREFLLENTLFDIGCKLMIFRWRRRRFQLWHFSLADTFLGEAANPETWCAGYLNAYSRLPAVTFAPGAAGEIVCRRKRRHVVGHREEIVRWCFRYKSRCHVNDERNQLVLWVFNYRRDADLDVIPADLRFSPDLHAPDSPAAWPHQAARRK